MAIKNFNKRLAEIGKIKIGGKNPEKRKSKSGGDYQLPIKFTHFVVTTTEKGPDDNYIINKEIMQQLGKEPKEISIRLPFDDIDMNFYTQYAYYQGNKCLCSGDGKKATHTTYDGKKEPVSQHINCNPETCVFIKQEKCKVSGILSCFLSCSMEIGGVYRFRTHSWNSVSSILGALEYFASHTNGVLMGIPLKLKLIKKKTQDHGTIQFVTVVLDGIEFTKMRELAGAEYLNRMTLKIDMKQIEERVKKEGFLDPTDEPEDIQEEYYPIAEEPKQEPIKEKGISADQVKEEIEKKQNPEPKQSSQNIEETPHPKDLF